MKLIYLFLFLSFKNIVYSFYDIFVNRFGSTNDSFMISCKIIDLYNINQNLLFINNTLHRIHYEDYKNTIFIKKPNHIKINGLWIKNIDNNKTFLNNNILGNNGLFIIDNNEDIYIPIESNIYLSYYGAILLKNGDSFNLNNNKILPLFKMNIGKNYVKNYLLDEKYGGGFYIEYHDLPHYHQPVNENSSGFIILGNLKNNSLFLTSFKIPYKHALFIPSNILHSDAYLIGEYNVIYGKTNKYSTVIFKNKNLQIKKVYIKT